MIDIKKKILFGITSLTIGGAERVLVDIANKLCEKYDITIFSIYDNGELKGQLKENVKFKSLYKYRYDELSIIQKKIIPIKILFFKHFIYKKYIREDFDVEIAFLEGPITRLFSCKNKNAQKIVWIHNDIEKVFGHSIKSKIKGLIDKNVYAKYDNLVFVSYDNMEKFKNVYKEISFNKMKVIYNYIDKDLVIKKSQCENSEFNKDESTTNFVSVCRLVQQKAIDRLIMIHYKLIQAGYNHKFYIIGDGPEKERLKEIIIDKGVSDTFKLLGAKDNPYPYMKDADYFCLLSYFEGYGMVLEEAKILGKNIIITDTAARECIKDYPNGVILGNSEDEIYNGLKKILDGKSIKQEKNSYKYDNYESINKIIDLVGE